MSRCMLTCSKDLISLTLSTAMVDTTEQKFAKELFSTVIERGCISCRAIIANEINPERKFAPGKEGSSAEAGNVLCDKKSDRFERYYCNTVADRLKDIFADAIGIVGSRRLERGELNYFLNMFFLNHPGANGEYSFGFNGMNTDPETRKRYNRDKIAHVMCKYAMQCKSDIGLRKATKSNRDRLIETTEEKLSMFETTMLKAKQKLVKLENDTKMDPKAKKAESEKLVASEATMMANITCAKEQLTALGAGDPNEGATMDDGLGKINSKKTQKKNGDKMMGSKGNEKMKRCFVCFYFFLRWKSPEEGLTTDTLKDETCNIVEHFTPFLRDGAGAAMSGGAGGGGGKLLEMTSEEQQQRHSLLSQSLRRAKAKLAARRTGAGALAPKGGGAKCPTVYNVTGGIKNRKNWVRAEPAMNRITCEVLINEMIFDMQDKTFLLARSLGLGVPPNLKGRDLYALYRQFVAQAIRPPDTWQYDAEHLRESLPNTIVLRGNSREVGYGNPKGDTCTDLNLCEDWNRNKLFKWFTKEFPGGASRGNHSLAGSESESGSTSGSGSTKDAGSESGSESEADVALPPGFGVQKRSPEAYFICKV